MRSMRAPICFRGVSRCLYAHLTSSSVCGMSWKYCFGPPARLFISWESQATVLDLLYLTAICAFSSEFAAPGGERGKTGMRFNVIRSRGFRSCYSVKQRRRHVAAGVLTWKPAYLVHHLEALLENAIRTSLTFMVSYMIAAFIILGCAAPPC